MPRTSFSSALALPLTCLLLSGCAGGLKQFHESRIQFSDHSKIRIPETDNISGEAFVFKNGAYIDFFFADLEWPPTYPGTRVPVHAWRLHPATNRVTRLQLSDKLKMVHFRHMLQTDLNDDGKADYLIVGHGTDRQPFPGEPTWALIAQARSGSFRLIKLPRQKARRFTFSVASNPGLYSGKKLVYLSSSTGRDLEKTTPWLFEKNDLAPVDLNLPSFVTERRQRFLGSLIDDIDGDGYPDLILGGHDSPKKLQPFASDVVFWGAPAAGFGGGMSPAAKKPDNAGKADRATNPWSQSAGLQWSIYSFLPERIGGPTWGTIQLLAVDFNNDGKKDLLALAHDHGFQKAGLQVHLNQGERTFKSEVFFSAYNLTRQHFLAWMVPGDFNGDGYVDVLLPGRCSDGKCSKTLPQIMINDSGKTLLPPQSAPTWPNQTLINAFFDDATGELFAISREGYLHRFRLANAR